MSYNPLDLGQPYGFETSLATTHVNSSSNLHLPSGMTESTRHLPAIAEPSTTSDTLVNHTGSESSQHRSTVPNQPSTSPPPAPLSHIRSAPITFPVNPAAHQPNAAQERDNVARMTSNDSTDGSPTPTIQGSNDDHQGVPLAAGGLHGQPLPGSKARDGEIPEKDPQAAGMGGKTGPGIAALGAAVLEVNKDGEYDEKSGKWESPASSVDDIKKIERTISGTVIPPRANTAAGGQTVQGLGMVPVTNRESRAPYVGFFGGVAPSGADAEEGLTVARSLGEEEEREAERERKGGPDPWSVRFDPGEKGNPKVSQDIVNSISLMG